LKQLLGEERVRGLKGELVKLNTVMESRRSLSPEFRAGLLEIFREEVGLLSRLLNRDLSHGFESIIR
jgi:hypothetical protein